MRPAPLPLVQHLQPTVHLTDLHLRCLLSPRLCLHLWLHRIDFGAGLRHSRVQLLLVTAHTSERLLASGNLLLELRYVEVRRGLLLHRAAQFDVCG